MRTVRTAAVVLALFATMSATASWAQHSGQHQAVRAADLKWAPVPSLPDAETVVQLHGTGPWGITYLNPADDPRAQ